ncbi:EAL domain-containing protein [Methylobacterium sp. J-026]|uniref:bifunctional diguanylate cyclase/phosphodiesterase n=1 Tax=Methylobacterium sp. J-026 TaxID=2836624 RepID=UPI001FB96B8D|nr:EAL domain-containing protein [Methylobacterium sp. J-026]MCJ2134259.1 EAL domain-containing protein [Methylobacterium sp. J-026]
MYRAFACLAHEHAAWTVPLAVLICWFSCQTVLRLFQQAREARGRARAGWLGAASLAAGSGIWSTHFIAMLGYDPGIGVGYDLTTTLTSLAIAITVTFVALALAQHRDRFVGTIVAGLVLSAGIAAMHFTGMLGIRLPGRFVWSVPVVATALAVSAMFSCAALFVAAHSGTRRPHVWAATLLTCAVGGLHFLAMGAVRVVPDPSLGAGPESLPRGALALGVAAVMLVVVAFCGLALLAERLHRSNGALREREILLSEKTDLLNAILETMDQGLMMVDAQKVVRVCNERAIGLLGLPAPMMRGQPTFAAVRDFQLAQQDFAKSGPDLRQWVARSGLELAAHTYERERPNGTVLEIRTVPLPAGGVVRTYTDITARKQAERRIAESEERLALALDAGSDGLWDCDLTTGTAWSSERWWGMLGYAPGELDSHARTWRALLHPEDALRAQHALDDHLSGHTPLFECEHRLRRKDGSWAWLMTRGRIVARDPAGTPLRFVGTQIDISARKEAQAQLAHMAHHDALTGLPNRTLFHECLNRRLAEIGHFGGRCAVLCLDLDRFKAVNDTLGHGAGDAFLRAITQRLRSTLQAEDTVARLGGDEFAILLGGTRGLEDVAGLVERLIAAVQVPIAFGEHRMQVGLSVGIAFALDHGAGGEDVLKCADLALYCAKAEGRNTFRFFDAMMDAAAAERRMIERDLRHAIEHDELTLYYQPQLRADTRDLLGFEALVRWVHPVRGLVSPADFVPIAEENGLILPLGEWVLRAACREAARWSGVLKVAVNLSPRQFQQTDLPERVLAILTETGLSPDRLELEVTESLIIDDTARAQSILRRLKEFGIRIAIDDFGTGYSSLAALQAFPFDKIKIDRSFVGRLEESAQAAVIVRAVLGLGRSLGMKVVAEGVETEAQMRFLADASCDEVQGFLIGRPQPITVWTGSAYDPRLEPRARALVSDAA